MNFLKKLFGIGQDDSYIGLSSFTNHTQCMSDKKPEAKKPQRKEPTLTELLKRAN